MSQAAYTKKIQVSSDNGVTWLDMPHTSASLDAGGDVLDDTQGGNMGWRSRLRGLNDWSISGEYDFEAGNAALAAARNAWLNRTPLLARYLPDGTIGNGFQGNVVVENFNQSGDVSSKETVSITMQADGALADAV